MVEIKIETEIRIAADNLPEKEDQEKDGTAIPDPLVDRAEGVVVDHAEIDRREIVDRGDRAEEENANRIRNLATHHVGNSLGNPCVAEEIDRRENSDRPENKAEEGRAEGDDRLEIVIIAAEGDDTNRNPNRIRLLRKIK